MIFEENHISLSCRLSSNTITVPNNSVNVASEIWVGLDVLDT